MWKWCVLNVNERFKHWWMIGGESIIENENREVVFLVYFSAYCWASYLSNYCDSSYNRTAPKPSHSAPALVVNTSVPSVRQEFLGETGTRQRRTGRDVGRRMVWRLRSIVKFYNLRTAADNAIVTAPWSTTDVDWQFDIIFI